MLACAQRFRNEIRRDLAKMGIGSHKLHDCRHTFSRLTEEYSVREAERRRMPEHSFGTDITNSVYGHREPEDLRTEPEKIRICC